ncbi:MAG: hypothetical protein ACHQT8_07425 [Chlamydiales bacterium]
MAAETAFGVLVAAGTRLLISQQIGLSTPVGLTYNLVDMAVSALVIYHLSEDNGYVGVQGALAGRITGVVAGILLTSVLCGPINLLLAVALNVSSLAVSMIIKNATDNRQALIV